MTGESLDTAEEFAESVADHLHAIFATVDDLAALVRSCRRPGRGLLREEDLAPVAAAVRTTLPEEPLLAGCGFVADRGIVAGPDPHYMLWWQLRGFRATRLRLNLDPDSLDLYDYLTMPWFTLAREGQRRVIEGPYVDYSGSDLFTMTLSVPVLDDGEFLGITGADLQYLELERRLTRVLRQAAGDACLLNRERRVIAANSARWVVSTRLPEQLPAEPGERLRMAPVPGGYGWSIVLASPDSR